MADGSHLKLRPEDLAYRTAYINREIPYSTWLSARSSAYIAIATSHGAHVIVVLQPSKEETYLPLLDGTIADPGAPLRAALEARGIEYLDLLPAFREHAEAGATLFLEFDGHPNAEGISTDCKEVLAHLKSKAEEYGLPLPHTVLSRQSPDVSPTRSSACHL